MATQMIDGIAVEVSGEGPAVLCIHGLGGSSNVWTPLLPALHGHRVIRFDLPGSARSALPAEPLSIALFVRAAEQVLAALGTSRVTVLAHSLGTVVAQHFAVANPDKVDGLLLFGPLAAPPDQGRPGILARAALAREGLPAMQEIADAIVAGATGTETKAHNPLALALVRECVMRQSPLGYAASCTALAAAQPAPVEQLTVPVLLVTGDQDGVAPAAAAKALAARIGGSEVRVLAHCGHWTPFEKTAECSAAIEEFFQQLR